MTSTMVSRMGKKKKERKGKRAYQLARQECLKRARKAREAAAAEPESEPQRAGNTSVFQYFCMWAWENAFSIAVLIPQYFSIDTSVLQY